MRSTEAERLEAQRRELVARMRGAPLKEALAIQKDLDRLDVELERLARGDVPGQLGLC